eukprot:SAG11_NODE_14728_length_601_cov_14.133466_1_plen_24_part_10
MAVASGHVGSSKQRYQHGAATRRL